MNANESARPAVAAVNAKPWQKRVGHWLRVVVMFLSGGFIFPHALTEDDEPETAESQTKKP